MKPSELWRRDALLTLTIATAALLLWLAGYL